MLLKKSSLMIIMLFCTTVTTPISSLPSSPTGSESDGWASCDFDVIETLTPETGAIIPYQSTKDFVQKIVTDHITCVNRKVVYWLFRGTPSFLPKYACLPSSQNQRSVDSISANLELGKKKIRQAPIRPGVLDRDQASNKIKLHSHLTEQQVVNIISSARCLTGGMQLNEILRCHVKITITESYYRLYNFFAVLLSSNGYTTQLKNADSANDLISLFVTTWNEASKL